MLKDLLGVNQKFVHSIFAIKKWLDLFNRNSDSSLAVSNFLLDRWLISSNLSLAVGCPNSNLGTTSSSSNLNLVVSCLNSNLGTNSSSSSSHLAASQSLINKLANLWEPLYVVEKFANDLL